MIFKFLIENKTDNPGIVAEHGLSIYIEACGRKILFDAGSTALFSDNAKKMGVDLANVDTAVISHGHYDHTGGFPEFCRINDKAKIFIHRNAFRKSYGFKNGGLEKISSGIRWSERQFNDIKDRLVYTDGPVKIADNIFVTGTVPVTDGFEPTGKFYYRDELGELKEDDMSHEQCLVINEKEGIYIFSGCSHRGAVSALNAGKSLFPGKRVAAFVAGMHLYNSGDRVRSEVISQIAQAAEGIVVPVHCTGIKGICEIKNILDDRCMVMTAGDEYHGR